jgi:hypothetical protein
MDMEDTKQLLEATGRFAAEHIAGMAGRPEHPLNLAPIGVINSGCGRAGHPVTVDG